MSVNVFTFSRRYSCIIILLETTPQGVLRQVLPDKDLHCSRICINLQSGVWYLKYEEFDWAVTRLTAQYEVIVTSLLSNPSNWIYFVNYFSGISSTIELPLDCEVMNDLQEGSKSRLFLLLIGSWSLEC